MRGSLRLIRQTSQQSSNALAACSDVTTASCGINRLSTPARKSVFQQAERVAYVHVQIGHSCIVHSRKFSVPTLAIGLLSRDRTPQ